MLPLKVENEASPCAIEQLSGQLGWAGQVLPDVTLCGLLVDVVFRVDVTAHAQRRCEGLIPVADAWLLQCRLQADPSFEPLRVIEIVGVVARRRTWKAARDAARAFRAVGPGLAILPSERMRPHHVLDADLLGVGLATASDRNVKLLVAPPLWSAPRRTWMTRLLEETVYDHWIRRTAA